MLDSDAADAEWAAKTGVRLASGTAGVAREVAKPPKPAPAMPVPALAAPVVAVRETTTHATPPRDPDSEEDFNEARTRKEIAAADLAEFKRDLEAGKLAVAADVKRAWSMFARALRDTLLAVPDRIADQLSGLDDADDCRALVDAEIRRALTRLSDDPPDYRFG